MEPGQRTFLNAVTALVTSASRDNTEIPGLLRARAGATVVIRGVAVIAYLGSLFSTIAALLALST
jgi:hypothetical protein